MLQLNLLFLKPVFFAIVLIQVTWERTVTEKKLVLESSCGKREMHVA